MFAHQVIDQIRHYKLPGIIDLISIIKQAQCFNLNKMDYIYEVIQDGKILFQDSLASFELPYPICWFDWSFKADDPRILNDTDPIVLKRCLLVTQESQGSPIYVIVFGYWLDSKRWRIGPCTYTIKPGTPAAIRINWASWVRDDYQKDEFKKQILLDDTPDLTVLNYVLLLLSCKNITTEPHDPPAKLNKARHKRGKQPLFTYHTLVLKPVGKKQESIPKDLWNNRIHLQRGHFKTYTQESPLFGSITGRFWWQPHVRGKNREGVVMKDYEVKAQ